MGMVSGANGVNGSARGAKTSVVECLRGVEGQIKNQSRVKSEHLRV